MSSFVCEKPPERQAVDSRSNTGLTTSSSKHSYGEILKSSALVGGSSAVNIAIGIARTKAMAMLLGPAGFGLNGLYSSISDVAVNLAGMGVNSSGVRQIAEAVGSGDATRVARTSAVLKRTSIVLGLFGAFLLVMLSGQVSNLTFSNPSRAGAICLLSLAILFKLVSSGQGALIQGMRRISDLAKMTILGAAFGTAISIPLVYFFRENGIVPSLVAVAGMSIVTSWWYSKKISVEPVRLTPSEVRREVSPLLKLGFAFMASSVMMMGSAYVVRIIILRHLGFEATGLYQAAWTLGGLYVGIVLQAMGADFYPRLTASARDNVACNRLVNEQARIGLLLAGAGVMVTLTFAPAVIWLFYTAKFRAAVEILRWISLGTALQVITWPMGYIILAKGKQKAFFWSEVAWTAVYLSLTWACVRSFGLMGAGLAFFGSYVFHALLIYPIVHCLSGFRWTDENKRTGTLLLTLTVIVFAGFYLFGFWIAVSVGVCVSIFSALYSVRVLLKLFPMDRIPDPLRLVLVKLRLAPSV